MNLFARIAQMESSRIVGGRAQTQALLRAPGLSSRQHIGRGRYDHAVGSRGEGTQTNPHAEILLPAGSIASPVSVLKSLNLTQAVLDGFAAVFWILFLAALAGSLPLAVALMIFAAF